VALLMAMAVTVLPLPWLGAEGEQRPGRWRSLRLAIAVLGSVPMVLGVSPAWSAGALALLAVAVAWSARGAWRVLAVGAMVAVVGDVVLRM
jgi:hypothetical protein